MYIYIYIYIYIYSLAHARARPGGRRHAMWTADAEKDTSEHTIISYQHTTNITHKIIVHYAHVTINITVIISSMTRVLVYCKQRGTRTGARTSTRSLTPYVYTCA